ncbi:hypothetical protein ANRL2_02143 [Anaerolineae bacterium]|nr:hypothetical protein ANRL2_02143 [Anaerolineae bacterium]
MYLLVDESANTTTGELRKENGRSSLRPEDTTARMKITIIDKNIEKPLPVVKQRELDFLRDCANLTGIFLSSLSCQLTDLIVPGIVAVSDGLAGRHRHGPDAVPITNRRYS